MIEKTRYVLGFIFNRELSEVALLRKSRPEWQAGMLNGIGGHIEEGETALHAMIREREEEVTCIGDECVRAAIKNWHWIMKMEAEVPPAFSCDVFWTALPVESLNGVILQREDQPVVIVNTHVLCENCLSNLRWIIPMCCDRSVADGRAYLVEAIIGAAP